MKVLDAHPKKPEPKKWWHGWAEATKDFVVLAFATITDPILWVFILILEAID